MSRFMAGAWQRKLWCLAGMGAVLLSMGGVSAGAAERGRRAHWVERAAGNSQGSTESAGEVVGSAADAKQTSLVHGGQKAAAVDAHVINQRAARTAAARQRHLENYPKFNGAFSSRFYSDYGYPTGTHGLRMLPW